MKSTCVYFILDLEIHEGNFADFEAVVKAMDEGTAKEPGALAYDWFLSNDGKRCRLLEAYADADAVQAHLAGHVVQQLVPKLLGFARLARFEVYGAPSAQGAAALEAFGAEIFRHWSGISLAESSTK